MLLFNLACFRILCKRKRNTRSISPSGATRDGLNGPVHTVGPGARKAPDAEMQAFFKLHSRYLTDGDSRRDLDWDKVQTPDADQIIPYDQLPKETDPGILSKLAVLKLNGGLGTSLGTCMASAMSILEVKDGMTFLDLSVEQVKHLNKTQGVNVPLLLMTSLNTHDDTLRILQKYADQPIKITVFSQSRYPRILPGTSHLCLHRARDDESHCGTLDHLLADGKEYLFVSNTDNLGAIVDQKILQYIVNTSADFLMEVTNKTKGDAKGGTLVQYNGSMRLLENAQVPTKHLNDFKSVHKFKIFNTNNLWINLKALKKIMADGGMDLDIIVNPVGTDDGEPVIQLETAAGAAINHFKNARGINVPRSRFLPVKSCSDLLLVESDIYLLRDGQLVMGENRMFSSVPVIKLGDHFRRIQDFKARFKKVPGIIDLDHLTVAGNVHFGRGVTLRGTVIIVADEGQRIDIPDGCVLENRLVSGSLNMIDL